MTQEYFDNLPKEALAQEVTTLIQKIQEANELIGLHRQHDDDSLMIRQYARLRGQFVIELKMALPTLTLDADTLAFA